MEEDPEELKKYNKCLTSEIVNRVKKMIPNGSLIKLAKKIPIGHADLQLTIVRTEVQQQIPTTHSYNIFPQHFFKIQNIDFLNRFLTTSAN